MHAKGFCEVEVEVLEDGVSGLLVWGVWMLVGLSVGSATGTDSLCVLGGRVMVGSCRVIEKGKARLGQRGGVKDR